MDAVTREDEKHISSEPRVLYTVHSSAGGPKQRAPVFEPEAHCALPSTCRENLAVGMNSAPNSLCFRVSRLCLEGPRRLQHGS